MICNRSGEIHAMICTRSGENHVMIGETIRGSRYVGKIRKGSCYNISWEGEGEGAREVHAVMCKMVDLHRMVVVKGDS